MPDNVKSARWLSVAGSILLCLTPLLTLASRAQAPTADRQPAIHAAVDPAAAADPFLDAPAEETAFFEDLEQRTFEFFWNAAQPDTGLVPDRFPGKSLSSIAAVGFGLTAYPIGVERHYITREQAQARVLMTLRFLSTVPSEHGFLYHFLDLKTGQPAEHTEVSTIDTTLLLAGVLFCEGYFDTTDPKDVEIRELAELLYRRVDWTWAQHHPPAVSIGWTPADGFSRWDWDGYNEAMLLYVLALGSPVYPVSEKAWTAWTRTYKRTWGTYYGEKHLGFAPLFGHQYSHIWIDFRGIHDEYMRQHGIDYFENSRRATLAQRRYAIANPMSWTGYGENVWGLSASDGPANTSQVYRGEQRRFFGYTARGAGLVGSRDDGTLAPTALISSLPFAPEYVIPAVLEIHHRYGDKIYSTYGFYDAFNPSFGESGWYDQVYLGIDQGPILAMLENYRSGLVWRVMRANPYVQHGLQRAGFAGGWLARLHYAGAP
jgi:hypothetical protein